MKKLIAMLLCLTAVATLFSIGCVKPKTDDTQSVKLDIDLNQKPELDILLPNTGYDDKTLNADYNAGVVETITGYKSVYSQLPATDASSNLTMKFMDKSQYNAMKVTRAQFADLLANDSLLDLTAGIDKFCVGIKDVISSESWEVVSKDGKIYGIPERASSDNIEYPVVIRQDWLNELNLNMPETKEDLRAALVAIKNKYGKDSEGNSILGFYPLTFDKYTPLVYAICPAFDIYADWTDVDGALKYYMEMPKMKEYVDFMVGLVNDGLIDPAVSTNDAATAIGKFTSGKSGAIATSLWSVPAIVSGLKANGVITELQAGGEQTDFLCYLRSLKNSKGEFKVYRKSGYQYITIIPYYMGDEAGYALDWINKKLIDTDQTHNFRNLVIGEENVHFTISKGEYVPITEKFSEKDSASNFLTGTNEKVYTTYWKARIKKNPEMNRAWNILMRNADSVGVYNPLDFAPPLSVYYSKKANMEVNAMDNVFIMLCSDKSSSNLSKYVQKWQSEGGTESSAEINAWYKNR